MDRTAIAVLELGVGLEVGAARAVAALVGAGVDVAVVVDPLHDLGDLRHVLRVGGADEEVVRDAEPGGEILEAHRVPVAELARRDAEPLGLLRDGLSVLVGPREEEHVLPALPHVPREHVGRDRRVGVAKMRLAVHVVDGGGDVVRHPRSMLPAREPLADAPECLVAPARPQVVGNRCVFRYASPPPGRQRTRRRISGGWVAAAGGRGARRCERSGGDGRSSGRERRRRGAGRRTRAPNRCPDRCARRRRRGPSPAGTRHGRMSWRGGSPRHPSMPVVIRRREPRRAEALPRRAR